MTGGWLTAVVGAHPWPGGDVGEVAVVGVAVGCQAGCEADPERDQWVRISFGMYVSEGLNYLVIA